jgi:uncharacterized protein YdaU (DUF1376 family)
VHKTVENQPVVGENESGPTSRANGTPSLTTPPAVKGSDGMADTHDTTTQGKAPAFQFYPKEFQSDCRDGGFSLQETGAYMLLMCAVWNRSGISSDVAQIAKICGVPVTVMRRMWTALRPFFIEHPGQPGMLTHPRLEKRLSEQAAFRRRQSDKGKASACARLNRKATGRQPEGNRTDTGQTILVDAGLQPEPNSTICDLQSPIKRSSREDGMGPDERLRAIAYELREIYPEVYAECRAGAVYRTTFATEARDNPKYYGLAELHPDIRKLREMLKIFLTRPLGDNASPGTPGQFLNMAPECDEVLRRSGWKASA